MVLTSGTKQLAEYSYVVTPISSSVEKTILLLLVSGAGAFLNQVFMYSCLFVYPCHQDASERGSVGRQSYIHLRQQETHTRGTRREGRGRNQDTDVAFHTGRQHITLLCTASEEGIKASPLTTIPRPPDIPQRNQPSAQKQHLANCEATKIRGFEVSHGQLKGFWKGIGVAIGKGDLLTPSVNFAIKEDLRAEM